MEERRTGIDRRRLTRNGRRESDPRIMTGAVPSVSPERNSIAKSPDIHLSPRQVSTDPDSEPAQAGRKT
jgi:hypothetical protein